MHNRAGEIIVKYLETLFDLNKDIFRRRFSEGRDLGGRLFFDDLRVTNVESVNNAEVVTQVFFISSKDTADARLKADAEAKKVILEKTGWKFPQLSEEEQRKISREHIRVEQNLQAEIEKIFNCQQLMDLFFKIFESVEIKLDEASVISIKHQFYQAILKILVETPKAESPEAESSGEKSPEWEEFKKKLKKWLPENDPTYQLIVDKILSTIVFKWVTTMAKFLKTEDIEKHGIISKILISEAAPQDVADKLTSNIIFVTTDSFNKLSQRIIKLLTSPNANEKEKSLDDLVNSIPTSITSRCRTFQFKVLGIDGVREVNLRLAALLNEVAKTVTAYPALDRSLLSKTLADISRQIFNGMNQQYGQVELRGALLDSVSDLCGLAIYHYLNDFGNNIKRHMNGDKAQLKQSLKQFGETLTENEGKLAHYLQFLGEKGAILLNDQLVGFIKHGYAHTLSGNGSVSRAERKTASKIARQILEYLKHYQKRKNVSFADVQSARQLFIEVFKYADDKVRKDYENLDGFLGRQVLEKRDVTSISSPRSSLGTSQSALSPRSSGLLAENEKGKEKEKEPEKKPEKKAGFLISRSFSSRKLTPVSVASPVDVPHVPSTTLTSPPTPESLSGDMGDQKSANKDNRTDNTSLKKVTLKLFLLGPTGSPQKTGGSPRDEQPLQPSPACAASSSQSSSAPSPTTQRRNTGGVLPGRGLIVTGKDVASLRHVSPRRSSPRAEAPAAEARRIPKSSSLNNIPGAISPRVAESSDQIPLPLSSSRKRVSMGPATGIVSGKAVVSSASGVVRMPNNKKGGAAAVSASSIFAPAVDSDLNVFAAAQTSDVATRGNPASAASPEGTADDDPIENRLRQ